MNKTGIYFAYWEREWNADYCSYINRVKKLGFDCLEVEAGSLLEMKEEERKRIRDTAEREGIELTYCIGLPPKYDVASENAEVRKVGIAYLNRLFSMIHSMGGGMLGGIIYSCWPFAGASWEYKKAARQRSIDSVREAAKTAEEFRITCCLEVVNRFEQCILNTAQEGVDFVNEVGSEYVKLLLDTFHMNIEEDSIGDAIRLADGKIGHFHIGECNRKVPGKGHMPWKEIFSALKDINYQEKIVMEPFVKPGGQVGSDIKMYRDLSAGATEEQMDMAAGEALAFIRSLSEG